MLVSGAKGVLTMTGEEIIKANQKYTLKQLRALRNMTRQELADAVGVHYNTIMFYENDVNKLRQAEYEVVEKIAEVLEVKIDNIFLNANQFN